jgi:hypothetical protein
MEANMTRNPFVTVVSAIALVALCSVTSFGEEADRSKLPPWFVKSDVVFIAERDRQLLVVSEILKALTCFRVSDLAPRSRDTLTAENDKPKAVLFLVSIPTLTDARQQSVLDVREFQVKEDSVDIDGNHYQLSNVRIALTMQQYSH